MFTLDGGEMRSKRPRSRPFLALITEEDSLFISGVVCGAGTEVGRGLVSDDVKQGLGPKSRGSEG